MKRLLVLLLILVAACSGGSSSGNYNTGSDGIVLDFFEGYPDTEVYEQSPLPIIVVLSNKGATTVNPDKLTLSWAYDPLYISAPKESTSSFVSGLPNPEELFGSGFEANENNLLSAPLQGRSAFYPQGEEVTIEEYKIATNKIIGSRQEPTTEISAMVCYEYKTSLATGVCIDVDKYLRTGREQACVGQDLAPGTQGAPIAFTHVEVRTNPVATGGEFRMARPEFIITLRNAGGGILVAPPQNDFKAACGLQGLANEELGAVRVNGSIFGVGLECSPEIVRIRNGEGKTRCTVADEDLGNSALAVQQNLMTILQLEASYIYRSSIAQEVKILSNPVGAIDGFVSDIPQEQGYVYDAQGLLVRDPNTGLPQIKCDVAAQGGRVVPDDPRIAPTAITADWSCACGRQECQEMSVVGDVGDTRSGFCTYGLCPENSFCCDKSGYESFKKAESERDGGSS